MTALKWTITTQERNALVETHLGCIWWTINKNRRLISAAGLDDEDVFQQLAIRMIRAVENYDPDKGKDLEQHIFAQLQYEVLNCKDAAKLYGIKGAPYGARDLTVSLDALVETGVQFCGGVALMSKFKTVCGVIAFVLFFLMLGAVGAIEQDIVPLFPGMVRVFALMALWVLFCNLAGAFDYTEPERRKPREVRREDPVARTGRTSRQSPCPSGRAKNYR